MQYALIRKGICENVIDADQAFVEKILPEWDEILLAEGTMAERGATWDGKDFIRQEPSPAPIISDPLTTINSKLDALSKEIADIKAATAKP